MKKIFSFMVLLALSFSVVACTGGKTNPDPNPDPVDEIVALKTSVAGENDKRLFTYLQAEPLEMPDGKIINSGDLKPMWQFVESQLKLDLTDTATPGQKPKDMFDLAAATQFKHANIYGGPNLGQNIMSAGVDGYFVDLSAHFDNMPNLSAYLDENPLVKSSITASNGKIYHLPYIAEINNYARMFAGRYSWVTALLDGKVNGEAFTHETETATLNVSYEAYWKSGSSNLPYGGLRKATNVIDLQNAAALGGQLTQAQALQVLKDYIDATYPTLVNRSDLFLGETAQYDIDELVALFRVIKLSPNTLSKESTGAARPGAVIWPYFARQSNYREEVLRLITYFGGQRVHGSDAYGARFYLDEAGVLQYSYFEDEFLDQLNRIKSMFSEGLVDEKLAGAANTTNLRSGYIFKDAVETQLEFGFMTYDFTASTTALTGGQNDVKAMLPPLTTTPASSGQFLHYVENSRVVKGDGWGISKASTDKEIAAAIKLFDYFFSEEGAKVQNYGTPDLWETDAVYVNPFDNTEGPKFNSWTSTKAAAVTNGDISSFLRDHIGAQIPIGYQKVIGFELQSTSENGLWSWELYFNANNGAGVKMNSYSDTNPYYQLVPPVFSLTRNENSLITTTTTMTADTSLIDKMFAFLGSKTGEGVPTTSAEVKQLFEDSNVRVYIEIYRWAYARMKSN